ncbi:MAG: ORF6N domain-containing protein [Ferruginibacter sp.]
MHLQLIQNRIYEIRGEKVMLDFDLSQLYEVETRVFNQAIKRNVDNFPEDFMFRLTNGEWKEISSSQIVMMDSIPKNRTGKYLPYAFTQHGVTMLSSVLRSPKARKMNIAIVRAFIALKKFALKNNSIIALVRELHSRIDEHDIQLKSIYDAIENLMDENVEQKLKQKGWEERVRIGFKK